MVNMTFENVNSLNSLEDSLFPLCYSPFIRGIHMSIQKGHIFLTSDSRRLNNANLIELIKEVRMKTLQTGYIVSATLISKSMDSSTLMYNLLNQYGELPYDLEVHLTDLVKDDSIDVMLRETRNTNLWYLRVNNDNPNIKYHKHNVAKDAKELKNLISPLLFDESINGVTLHKPNGGYNVGYSIDNYESINIECSKKVVGVILDVNSITRFLGSNRGSVNILNTVKVQLPNGVIINQTLDQASIDERILMWTNRGVLYNAPIELEITELPLVREPVVNRIISIC